MLIAITIAVILASFVGVSFRKYVETKKREVEIITFWKELSGLRAKAMKYDCPYIVKFYTATNTYKIFKDVNNDGVGVEQPSPLPSKIYYGMPNPSNGSSWPAGSAPTKTPIDVNWDTSMKIERDQIGSINTGKIFLKVPENPKLGYCITVLANKQTIKLYKWTGAQWIEM